MPLNSPQVRWEVFARSAGSDRKRSVYYVRAIDKKSRKILLTKSTRSSSKRAARALIAELSSTLNLQRIVAAKTGCIAAERADSLSQMSLAKFFEHFWDPSQSPYLLARADSNKPLSKNYVNNQASNTRRFACRYPDFLSTPLYATSLFQVEAFLRYIRKSGVSGNLANDALDAIRTPLSWAMKRGLVDSPFSFRSIVRPKEMLRKRGILTREELLALIDLNVEETIIPRPRLKKGEKHQTPGPVDIRIKVGALLGHLCGMRAGEIRALCWKSINLVTKRIEVSENFVEGDGQKAPKRGSVGSVPIPEQLISIIKELKRLSFKLGMYGADNHVLFNIRNPANPIALSTLEDGFTRCCEWIGIPNDPDYKKENRQPMAGSRQDRHIVFHSGRHMAASLLAEAVGPELARKVTRHRTIAAFEGYAAHQTEEGMETARLALFIEKPKPTRAVNDTDSKE